MKKRAACLLLALLTLWAGALGAAGENAPAQPRPYYIFVNGQEVADAHALLENGVTYVSAYQVVRAFVPDVTAAWESDLVLTGTGFTLSAQYGRPYVVCNGRYLYAPGQIRLHPENGDLLLPVRLLARMLGANLGWDEYGVYLSSGAGPLESGETFYNADELQLLARTIRHEGGSQPLEGQIAVANVILNRVRSAGFPNTIYDVIYQKGQFANSENSVPEERHYIAAKLALDGAEIVPASCCWFNATGKSFWASNHKALLCTIGSQSFYG